MTNWTGLIAAAALCLPLPALAQDDSNAQVLATVDTFLAGINAKDPARIASVSVEGAMIASMMQNDAGDRYRARPMATTVERLTSEEGDLHESYWDPTVLIDGPIAVVWAPYSFDENGTRSHCGIDVFNLFRLDGSWKITSVQYTIEPDNCPKGR